MIPATLEFTVPGPPQPKERARTVRGHSFTPARTATYERLVALLALKAGAKPWFNPVRLTLRFYCPDARRRDWDNLAKSVCDALNGTGWNDDSQIVAATVEKCVDRAQPRVWVKVEYLAERA